MTYQEHMLASQAHMIREMPKVHKPYRDFEPIGVAKVDTSWKNNFCAKKLIESINWPKPRLNFI